MESGEIERELDELESRVERLRALYEQYFMGLEKMEPAVPRKDVERRIWLLRREQIRNTGLRFKFQMIIQRYNTFQQYWARVTREIETGTYRRDVMRAAQRVGEKEALTILGKKRAKQYAVLLEAQRERLGKRKQQSEEANEAGGWGDISEVMDDRDAPAAAEAASRVEPTLVTPGAPAPTNEPAKPAMGVVGLRWGARPRLPPPAPTSQAITVTGRESEAMTAAHATTRTGEEPIPEAAKPSIQTPPTAQAGSRNRIAELAAQMRKQGDATLTSAAADSGARSPRDAGTGLDLDLDDGAMTMVMSSPPVASTPSTPIASSAKFLQPSRPGLQASSQSGAQTSAPTASQSSESSERPVRKKSSRSMKAVRPEARPEVAQTMFGRRPGAPPPAPQRASAGEPKPAVSAPAPPSPPTSIAQANRPATLASGTAPPKPPPPPLNATSPSAKPLTPAQGPRPDAPRVQAMIAPPRAPQAPPPQAASAPQRQPPQAPNANVNATRPSLRSDATQAASAPAPTTRDTSASTPRTRPEPTSSELSEQRIQQIYTKYVETKRASNESTAGVTYERLADSLRSQASRLRDAHPTKSVDYEVVVKDGKTMLKPILR